jgi:hypothetical protein
LIGARRIRKIPLYLGLIMPDHLGYCSYRGKVGISSFESSVGWDYPFLRWTSGPRKTFSNCYAFAADAMDRDAVELLSYDPSRTFKVHVPAPGTTGGRIFRKMTPGNVRKGLIADGFNELPYARQVEIPKDAYVISCYCRTEAGAGNDCHFYRYCEDDKSWHHKRWLFAPTNKDDKGNLINRIEDADRGAYNVLVGFFSSPPERERLNVVVENKDGRVVYGEFSAKQRFRKQHRSQLRL